MNLKEDVRPVTYLKEHVSSLLDQLDETRRPVVITQNGSARAVIQDAGTYEETRRAIGLLKLAAQGEADARSGRVRGADEVFALLRRQLKQSQG
jgi:PHD/YefM family antitoxin component YafN of YafNO toxin-antitoxin module